MRKRVSILFAAVIMVLLAACFLGTEAKAETDLAVGDVLSSDKTAIDFLEGMWTDNLGHQLIAERGERGLIVWSTNLSIPACDVYFLREGILYGAVQGQTEMEVLKLEIADDNTLMVTNCTAEERTRFLRVVDEIDLSRRDNGYVFHSMAHAIPYLTGIWMNDENFFFNFSADEAGNFSFQTNLPYPQMDSFKFYGGVFCGASGGELQKLFTFDIQGENVMGVYRHLESQESVFHRLGRNLDEALLNEEFVFSNNQDAFAFLEGKWSNEEGTYFKISNQDGSLSWNTNLPLDNTMESYAFANGGLMGTTTDENGETSTVPIYTFEIISQDEIIVTVCQTEEEHTLIRTNEEFVFSDNQDAFAFLEGKWSNEEGTYFKISNQDGSLSWNTNLPLDDTMASYGFANGGLMGTKTDDKGETATVPIYTFEIISRDEITVTVCQTGEKHTLTRAEE